MLEVADLLLRIDKLEADLNLSNLKVIELESR
jgi:hypothetical protein